MYPKDAEGMGNCVDHDQTASSRASDFGSALFAQACLSETKGFTTLVFIVNEDQMMIYCMCVLFY